MNTLIELSEWMEDQCYNSGAYSLLGNPRPLISDAYVVEIIDGQYVWFYTERGGYKKLASFDTEADFVAHIFPEILANKGGKRHCVGLTSDPENSLALQKTLTKRGIEFTISVYSYSQEAVNPWHHVFIYGCDMKRAEDLLRPHYPAEATEEYLRPNYFKASRN